MIGLYPGARYRPVPYAGEAGHFTAHPLGWILHVVVGNGSPYNTFASARSPKRRFSHFWVAKNGEVEQYAPTSQKSWAMGDGNATYWSIETEGVPENPLTDAQVNALARLHNWLGAADAIASRPGQKGIGTHYMGGAAWGGHSCPDPMGHEGRGQRSNQRADIIARARELRTPTTLSAHTNPPKEKTVVHDPLDTNDLTAIADVTMGAKARYQVHAPDSGKVVAPVAAFGEVWLAVDRIADAVVRVEASLARIEATLAKHTAPPVTPPTTPADPVK